VKRGFGGRPADAFSCAVEAPSFTPSACVAEPVYVLLLCWRACLCVVHGLSDCCGCLVAPFSLWSLRGDIITVAVQSSSRSRKDASVQVDGDVPKSAWVAPSRRSSNSQASTCSTAAAMHHGLCSIPELVIVVDLLSLTHCWHRCCHFLKLVAQCKARITLLCSTIHIQRFSIHSKSQRAGLTYKFYNKRKYIQLRMRFESHDTNQG
jgi:hypothetical protein